MDYILMAAGLLGFYLAGRKVWWAWYVNIATQVLWFIYAVTTQQWGFLLGAIVYTVLFSINAYKWTRDRPRKTVVYENRNVFYDKLIDEELKNKE